MCGIWGYLFKNTTDVSYEQIKNLLECFYNVKQRGPDRSEFIDITSCKRMFIGFHRLAIMDITSDGDQPFRVEHEGRTIYSTCNGEIYNYKELVKEHNLKPTSNSDCEVIHLLYLKYGFDATVRMLIGEFATSLIDIDHKKKLITMYLSRDPLGVRPLYYGEDDVGICYSSILKGYITSDESNKHLIKSGIRQFPPGEYMTIKITSTNITKYLVQYYSYAFDKFTISKLDTALLAIRKSLTEAVIRRLQTDRPFACLLSGGLDSSLVVSIAARELKKYNKRLQTFSIGMKGGTDEANALKVAKFCDTDHTHITLPNDKFIDALSDVVWCVESYDTTTCRATTGQYLACKWIAETTDIKVLLIGDGSDELTGGYIYFHKAPSAKALNDENRKLLKEIYLYDGQRADRGVAYWGLEARTPFLDHTFVDMYMSIEPSLRLPKNGQEKWLLRRAFDTGDYLPDEILNRRKEAFSDGVSSVEDSWHTQIQKHVDTMYTDNDLDNSPYTHCKPTSKEALYFRDVFHKHFGKSDIDGILTHYWLPNQEWVGEMLDPSARALSEIYS
jgi:asparagine synthase (glutamine-hydrolysing)